MCVRKDGKMVHCFLENEIMQELYKLSRVVSTKKTYIEECLMTLRGELGKNTSMCEAIPNALISEICQFWLGYTGEGDMANSFYSSHGSNGKRQLLFPCSVLLNMC